MIKLENKRMKNQNFEEENIEQFLRIRESWESIPKMREIIPKPEKKMICKRCKKPR